jgi:O-antigen ligase
MHSHNDYLQTWYETGAVGALMLLVIGLLVLSSLARSSMQVQPYLYASFATSALLGGTSFSLWQPWFMASFGLTAVFAMLGWAMADRSGAHEQDRFRSLHALNAPAASALPICALLTDRLAPF